jgi:hypothetical protein
LQCELFDINLTDLCTDGGRDEAGESEKVFIYTYTFILIYIYKSIQHGTNQTKKTALTNWPILRVRAMPGRPVCTKISTIISGIPAKFFGISEIKVQKAGG